MDKTHKKFINVQWALSLMRYCKFIDNTGFYVKCQDDITERTYKYSS